MHHCGAGARGARGSEEGGERRGEAGGAEAAVARREVGWGGGFECAVLCFRKMVFSNAYYLVNAMGEIRELG